MKESNTKRKREAITEMRSNGIGMEQLTHNLIEEILYRVDDVKYVLRCKSVSKLWNSLIKSTSFVSTHQTRAQSRNPQVLLGGACCDTNSYDLRTMDYQKTQVVININIPLLMSLYVASRAITGSCDGLVCVYDFHDDLYVINPATRWSRSLPRANIQQIKGFEEILDHNTKSTQNLLGFGKDTRTGEYKMVWLYNSSELGLKGRTTCEVFEFTTNTWRYVTGSPHRICDGNFNNGPVYLDGLLHWFTEQIDGKTKIISLDMHTEVFQVMPEIPLVHASPKDIIMHSLNNRLCISEKKINSQDIWSLNAHKVWEKNYTINLEITSHLKLENTRFYRPSIPITPVTCFNKTQLLLHYAAEDYYWGRQSFKTGRVSDPCLLIQDTEENCYQVFSEGNYLEQAISYIPSLLSV